MVWCRCKVIRCEGDAPQFRGAILEQGPTFLAMLYTSFARARGHGRKAHNHGLEMILRGKDVLPKENLVYAFENATLHVLFALLVSAYMYFYRDIHDPSGRRILSQ